MIFVTARKNCPDIVKIKLYYKNTLNLRRRRAVFMAQEHEVRRSARTEQLPISVGEKLSNGTIFFRLPKLPMSDARIVEKIETPETAVANATETIDQERLTIAKMIAVRDEGRRTQNWYRVAQVNVNYAILDHDRLIHLQDFEREAAARNDLWAMALEANSHLPRTGVQGGNGRGFNDEVVMSECLAAIRQGYPDWLIKESVNVSMDKGGSNPVNQFLRAAFSEHQITAYPAFEYTKPFDWLNRGLVNLNSESRQHQGLESWQDQIDLLRNMALAFPDKLDKMNIHRGAYEYFEHLSALAKNGLLVNEINTKRPDDITNIEAWARIRSAMKLAWPGKVTNLVDDQRKLEKAEEVRGSMAEHTSLQSGYHQLDREFRMAADLKILKTNAPVIVQARARSVLARAA